MDLIVLLARRGHAQLIQELERRWPGCGAHTKRNQATGAYDVIWSGLLPRDGSASIGAYVDGWRECLKFSVRMVQDASPFVGEAVPIARADRTHAVTERGQRRQTPASPPARRDEAAVLARARLEAQFGEPSGGES